MSGTSPSASMRPIRELVRETGIYGVATVLNRLAGFFLLPLYTRVLTQDDLGALWVLGALATFGITLLGMGMNSAVFRFYVHADEDRRASVVATATTCLAIPAALLCALVWLGREPTARLLTDSVTYVPHVGVALAGIFLEVLLIVPLAVLRADKRAARYAVVSVGRFLTTLALGAWFVLGLDMGALGVLWSTTAASAVAVLALTPDLLRRWGRVDGPLAGGLVRFGMPLILSTLAGTVVSSSDLWLLKHFRDLEEVGRYGTASRVARILQVAVSSPFVLAWPAMMWSVAKTPGAHRMYARVLTYAVTAMLLAASGMSIFRHEILGLFAPDTFDGLPTLLPWLAFGFVPSVATLVLNTGASLESRTGLIAATAVGAMVANVGLNLVFLPTHGMYAAAITTFVAYTVMATLAAIFCARIHPIAWEWGRILRATVLVGGLTLVALRVTDHVHGLGGVVIHGVAFLGVGASLLLPGFLGPQERGLLRRILGGRAPDRR